MKRDWYPLHGRRMLDQRQRGIVPTGPVNVSLDLAREMEFSGQLLMLRGGDRTDRIDWRMLANLDVWVWADESQPVARLVAVVGDIVAVKPKSLFVRFVDPVGVIHDVDCGTGTHRTGAPPHIPDEHSFLFCPLNSSGSALGRRLCKALARITTQG